MLPAGLASRTLAALLTATWAALALAMLLLYRAGGTADLLVVLSMFAPAVVAAGGLAWPPTLTPDARGTTVAWLGIVALLVSAPTVALAIEPLLAGRQPLLPSAQLAYAGMLALLATATYSGIGLIEARASGTSPAGWRHYRDALRIGILLTLLTAAAVGGATLANQSTIRDTAAAAPEWGPTDPALVPAGCTGPTVGRSALVAITAHAELDGVVLDEVRLNGERDGSDEHWSAELTGAAGVGFSAEYAAVGGQARLRLDGGPWQARSPGSQPAGSLPVATLDGRAAAVLSSAGVPAEDLGLEITGGAPARHCRSVVDGPRAIDAVLPLGWLIGQRPLEETPALEVWRGQADWWVFGDGHVGRATVYVGGHPSDAWPGSRGLRGLLRAELTATQRDVPRLIEQPLP